MSRTARRLPRPPPFAWLVLWLSQFLITGCLYSIPTLALRRPPRPGLPPHTPDWHLPLLLSAVCASAMTWQGWYTRNSDNGRYRPKPRLDPAAKRKRRLVIGLALGGPLLLLECTWVFGLAGGRADWPLLLALNGGMAAGWGLLAWATRLMPDPPGPDTDPLAPEAAPAAKSLPELVHGIAYADRAKVGLPVRLVWLLTFLGTSAMAVALVAGVMGRFWGVLAPLFVPAFVFVALAVTAADRGQRKHSGPQAKVAQNATGLLVCFLAIQVILRFSDYGHHENWARLLALDSGALVAYGFVRWTLTLPVAAPAGPPSPVSESWLTGSGVTRPTPTELVFRKPWGLRVFIGGFALVMWGMVGVAALLALDPTVFPGPYPHGLFWRVQPGVCGLGLAFFAFLISAGSGPRELRLDLGRRTCSLTLWKPLRGKWGQDAGIPFRPIFLKGSLDSDLAGVGLREYRRDGNSRFFLQLLWKDTARPAQVLRVFSDAEEARAAMLEASAALGLPAMGRCE